MCAVRALTCIHAGANNEAKALRIARKKLIAEMTAVELIEDKLKTRKVVCNEIKHVPIQHKTFKQRYGDVEKYVLSFTTPEGRRTYLSVVSPTEPTAAEAVLLAFLQRSVFNVEQNCLKTLFDKSLPNIVRQLKHKVDLPEMDID